MADNQTAATENLFDVEEEQPETEQKAFDSHLFQRMLKYILPYRKSASLAAAFVSLKTLMSVLEPLIVKNAIDHGISNFDYPYLVKMTALYFLVSCISWFSNRTQSLVINQTGAKVLYDLRRQLFEHIQKLSFNFYDSRPVGKIIARLTTDVNRIAELINGSLINILSQLLMLIVLIVMMLVLDVQLALISFSLIPFIAFFVYFEHGPLKGLWMKYRRIGSSITAHLNETVTGIQVIQAFSREKINTRKFAALNERYRKSYLKSVFVEILAWPVIDITCALATALVFFFGSKRIIEGTLSFGTLYAFYTYLNKFWSPLSTISKFYSQLLSANASAERVFEFLDFEPLVRDLPQAITLPAIRGEVEFDHITFAYQADRPVLHDVSFLIKPGSTIALVGPTGAGKSTIINLIARFYDPSAGTVRIDGHDLRDVTLQSLRSQLGIVLQDSFIFSGTIGENIRYGKLDATEAEIEAAAKAANAHGFIQRMELGYASVTEERGSTLSTGQRQLIAFARAILSDPRILILDEATSSIDTETELLIQKALATILKDRTSFIIAHRLSTIRNADLIMVIDHGEIQEVGTHLALLQNPNGIYRRLYETQYAQQEKMMLDFIA
ncbi:MAG TPA: ABC transporter ATP-binding protein [Bacillota bacterium]|nr:ABC transporter ATP-binding protein [Bacillota bacterium]